MITVIVPALNEEKTISQVVKYCWQQDHVTEVIVVDDNSSDSTAALAKEANATVIKSKKLGKGISMQEGVDAATNQILVFLDADIDPYPADTISMLTLPLINDEADFVKATFSRNAGRVTEIMAKPLLAVLYPDLLKYSQPLSGMIAGRKSFFEKIDFYNDYGVDIGILIDMYLMQARIQEVNIGYIENKSKAWHALGKMSMEVASAIVARAMQHRKEKVTNYTAEKMHALTSGLGSLIYGQSKGSKMVIFDMDDTILRGRFINTCAAYFGFTKKLEKLRLYESDPVILSKQIALLMESLSISDLLKVASGIPLVDDIKQVVKELKKRGYVVGIISDSYQVVANYVKNKIDADFAMANQLEYFEGKATGEIKIPSWFYRGKHSICNHSVCKTNAMLHVCSRYQVLPENCVAVGDSANDRCIIRHAGTGVAFCTKDELLRLVADRNINKPSFAELLHYTL
jgi:glucosyl-3-phosphoglycerate synthase